MLNKQPDVNPTDPQNVNITRISESELNASIKETDRSLVSAAMSRNDLRNVILTSYQDREGDHI